MRRTDGRTGNRSSAQGAPSHALTMRAAAAYARILLLLGAGSAVLGSAIPMWEFLSRTEKMNLLYSMFVKQVNEYCISVVMPNGADCQKVLLLYGLTNLAKMGEESLDKMDPYQRGATGIIWDSMMKGGIKSTENETPNKIHQTKVEDNETNSSDNILGSQVEASSNVPQYTSSENSKHFGGPMIIRVLPNGRPVPGEPHLPVVRDEDAEDFKLMRSQPPSDIMELASAAGNLPRMHVIHPTPSPYRDSLGAH